MSLPLEKTIIWPYVVPFGISSTKEEQCNNPFHNSSFYAHAVTVAKDATLFSQGTGSTP